MVDTIINEDISCKNFFSGKAQETIILHAFLLFIEACQFLRNVSGTSMKILAGGNDFSIFINIYSIG